MDLTKIILTHPVVATESLMYRGQEVIGPGYTAVWFLFKDEPYDIGRFYTPDGHFTGYYVDVLEPVRWHGSDQDSLRPLVDLFLDLWIAPDGSYAVLDEDEFTAALAAGWITPEQGQAARSTMTTLIDQVSNGSFPPALVREHGRRRADGTIDLH